MLMDIPDFQKLMLPFLEVIKDGRVYSTEQIVEMLRVHFGLTMEDMKVKVPNGNQSLFRNRIDWASNHLHQAGLVVSFLKGYYQITEAGEQVLSQEQVKMDAAYLRKFDQFQLWESMFDTPQRLLEGERETELQNETPEIVIGKATVMLYQSLKFELLSLIKQRPISFFEYFIVELMRKIGYKGVDSSNFDIIGKREKEGIEGIMYMDELGIEKIYMQAKKWQMEVTSKDIRNFMGALNLKGTRKGVFITTSTFSQEAKAEATTNPMNKIVLVDADRLMQLAIMYNVGIQTKRVVEIKGLDENF
ncbi:restriction endonuclease [Capnocytophaga sp. oral taxon 332 str. F0381]|uniref:restriction endonuclease n=1 Tax=Capnocytophaga sp. oral taxon 332 TaxID=712213 RepID=UPI0002A41EE3|nr:restriction endonuclease [Capnocytophaga sp. oral taxon 332]EKY10554.1 restriction endonuclease [Capnocytophaga sp. oral taxon 332 str. F0381]